jgi:hypothetical protein
MKTLRSIVATAACVFACASVPALAHGGGNGGGGGGGNGGGSGGHGSGSSSMGIGTSHAGGLSASHMSSKGLANTNSHVAADRDKGRDRASDRTALHAQSQSQSHTSAHSIHARHVAVAHET